MKHEKCNFMQRILGISHLIISHLNFILFKLCKVNIRDESVIEHFYELWTSMRTLSYLTIANKIKLLTHYLLLLIESWKQQRVT